MKTTKTRVTLVIPQGLSDDVMAVILAEVDAWGPPVKITQYGACVQYDYEIEVTV